MLKNKKTVYFCQECGYESAKWIGAVSGMQVLEHFCGRNCVHKEILILWHNEIIRENDRNQ